MAAIASIAALIVGVIALVASLWALSNRSSDAAMKAAITADLEARFRKQAISHDLFASLVSRVRDLEASNAARRPTSGGRDLAASSASATAAPSLSDAMQPWQPPDAPHANGVGRLAALDPAPSPIETARIAALMAAHQALVANPNFTARDRLIGDFELGGADADLAEAAPDSLYWTFSLGGGQRALLLPGWPVIKDWHTIYRGPQQGLARQVLMRCFDIAEGPGLRIASPAKLSAEPPWTIPERGRLEGA